MNHYNGEINMVHKIARLATGAFLVASFMLPTNVFATSGTATTGGTDSMEHASAQTIQAQNKPKREERIKELEKCRASGKTARETYRKALADSQAAYKNATLLARQKRDAAIKAANDAFKTAYAAATDDAGRKAAIAARKTAIEAARKAVLNASFAAFMAASRFCLASKVAFLYAAWLSARALR
jgi:uncharacterized membrane protein